MMGRVHLLPGTTNSSPTARGSYDSERTAVMTLSEFAHWLCLEIAGRYHQDPHRMLGTAPAAAWAASIATGVTPAVPTDLTRFLVSFLPVTRRPSAEKWTHLRANTLLVRRAANDCTTE